MSLILLFTCCVPTASSENCHSIYATPSNILRSSGSVGIALIMWLVGALIAACGTAVYIELGTGLPRSGGEKNYLEFIYRRPKFMATCAYTASTLIMVSLYQSHLLTTA